MLIAMEWWAFEVMSIMAGWIGVNEQASQLVVFNMSCFLYMLPMGLSSATATIIGQEIGKVDIPKAKEYYKVTAQTSIVLSTIVIILFYFNSDALFSIYTSISSV